MAEDNRPYKDKGMLEDLYSKQDKSTTQIAAILGCSTKTIWNWLEKFSIETRSSTETGFRHKKHSLKTRFKMSQTRTAMADNNAHLSERLLRDLYEERLLSANSIASQLDCSVSKIIRWLDFYKIKLRSPSEEKGGERNPTFGKPRSNEVKAKIRERLSGKPLSEEVKNKLRKSAHRGPSNPRWGKPPAHGRGTWYEGNGKRIWLRSSFELRMVNTLDRLGLSWKYEPKRFVLKDRTYAPDFYLPELNIWYEVKGWFHDRHQETVRQFRELYPEETLIVITKPILKMLESTAKRRVA